MNKKDEKSFFSKNNTLVPKLNIPSLNQLKYNREGPSLTGMFVLVEFIFNESLLYSLWQEKSIVYLLNGRLHNEHGPAAISPPNLLCPNHSIAYFQNGKIQTFDKGMGYVEYSSTPSWNGSNFIVPEKQNIIGFSCFNQEGQGHNLKGPASIILNQSKDPIYQINGVILTKEEFSKRSEVIDYQKKRYVRKKMKNTFV
jgi:hypothetical protein